MLTVITGGMFAEKSTELQRRGKRLKRAGKVVQYYKPDIDTRYATYSIVTHDGEKVECHNIPVNSLRYLNGINFDGVEAILIDEIQFFNRDFAYDIEQVLLKYPNLEVIVSGLDLDSTGKPFETTALLLCMAEKVVKLNAVCAECGSDSWVSYKVPNGKRIELGTDEYYPMCRKCYNKKI